MLVTKNGVPFYLEQKNRESEYGDYGEIKAYSLVHEEIGFLVYENDDKSGWIKDVGVDKGYYDQGVGHALVSAYEEFCKQSGKVFVAGLFFPMDRSAEIVYNFYQRHGYSLGRDGLPIIRKRISKKDKPFAVKETELENIF